MTIVDVEVSLDEYRGDAIITHAVHLKPGYPKFAVEFTLLGSMESGDVGIVMQFCVDLTQLRKALNVIEYAMRDGVSVAAPSVDDWRKKLLGLGIQ